MGVNFPTPAQSVPPITAEWACWALTGDWATRKGGLKRNDTEQFLKDGEIGFAEINSVSIFNIQACNPILVVPPNTIINPNKSMIWDRPLDVK